MLPYLTPVENVMLPLAIAKGNTATKKNRAVEALDRLGLGAKAERLANHLCSGEQGRVAIARALVTDSPLMLADEPTGKLDSKTGSEIIANLRSLNKQGQTIFMVTHSLEAATAAHRIPQIQDGLLV